MIRIFAGTTHTRAVPGRHAPIFRGQRIGLDASWVLDTDPDTMRAKDPDALGIARWLAEHVTSTSRYAGHTSGLVVVGQDRIDPVFRSSTDRYDHHVHFEYLFGMLFPGDAPEAFLVRHAYWLLDLHRRTAGGGVLFLAAGDARLPFTDLA